MRGRRHGVTDPDVVDRQWLQEKALVSLRHRSEIGHPTLQVSPQQRAVFSLVQCLSQ